MSNIVLHLQSKGDSLSTTINPPIDLSRDYEGALTGLNFYNSIQNVTTQNNVFTYTPPGGVESSITLAPGAYEVSGISDAVQRGLVAAGDSTEDTPAVIITGNPSTFKTNITTADAAFQIDFSAANSLAGILGFGSVVLSGSTFYESSQVVDIKGRIDSIRVFCDLFTGAFGNSPTSDTEDVGAIFSTVRKVSPGFLQSENITRPVFLPVNRTRVQTINLRLIDQDGRRIGLSDVESTNFTLELRPVKQRF